MVPNSSVPDSRSFTDLSKALSAAAEQKAVTVDAPDAAEFDAAGYAKRVEPTRTVYRVPDHVYQAKKRDLASRRKAKRKSAEASRRRNRQ